MNYLLVHHGAVRHLVLPAVFGGVDTARVRDAVSINGEAPPVSRTVHAAALHLRSNIHRGDSTRPPSTSGLRPCTYVLLHLVHSLFEIIGSVLVVGNHVGQAVLDDIVELRGRRSRGEQTLPSHRLAAATCGPHLVPEDVSGDGCCDLNDDHQREQDGKLGGENYPFNTKTSQVIPEMNENEFVADL